MTRVILTTTGAGTWTVPDDFPGTGTVGCLGAGGHGGSGGGGGVGGSGGGGAWATTDFTASPGDVISFHVGVAGGTQGAIVGFPAPGPGTGDTWFQNASTVCFAQAGGFGANSVGGLGGSSVGGVAGSSTVTKGGDGTVAGGSGGAGGCGGGGAAGPNGPGGDGGADPSGISARHGSGGGAANGGSDGSPGQSPGNGGNNRLGTGGGAGSVTHGVAGGNGSNGGGGGGGGESADGGNGSMDALWADGSGVYGPGGGGGGGGSGFFTSPQGVGGDAGGYGGGGGGMGYGSGSDLGQGTQGLIVISYAGVSPTPPPAPEVDTLAGAPYMDVLVRIATDPVIRLWSGLVRDIAIPAGGAETVDGAIYQSLGQLTDLPQLGAALNGEADRLDFSISGVAVTGEVAAIASGSAAEIRGVAVDVGLILFDSEWQLVPPVYWVWSGTADSLSVTRTSDAQAPTRTLTLSAGNVFTGRRRANLQFFTDIDQRRRSSDDSFFSEIAKLQAGATKVWGVG